MRQYILILLTGFLLIENLQAGSPTEKKINWGIKAGFNSAIPSTGVQTESGSLQTTTTNKVGYLGETFVRINMKKFYFQPEVAYSITKENINLEREDLSKYSTLKINVNAFSAGGIIGYNTVKQDQYELSVFVGCKYKYAYDIVSKPSYSERFTDMDPFYNLYAIAGLGVNIAHLFFDFRYDFAFMDNEVCMPLKANETYGQVIINKKANILSFSIGLIF